MGLLDDITGQVLGGSGAHNNLVNEVVSLLGNRQTGGLEGLVKQFAGNGLGDLVNSWVGMGQNLPITPQQVKQGLGSDTVSQLAGKLGLSHDQVSSHLSALLPQIIDKLTPNGQVPQGDIMSQGMDLLKGLMK